MRSSWRPREGLAVQATIASAMAMLTVEAQLLASTALALITQPPAAAARADIGFSNFSLDLLKGMKVVLPSVARSRLACGPLAPGSKQPRSSWTVSSYLPVGSEGRQLQAIGKIAGINKDNKKKVGDKMANYLCYYAVDKTKAHHLLATHWHCRAMPS